MFPKPFQKLIDHFAALPSIGPKLAERLVLYLWKYDKDKINDFAQSLTDLKDKIRFCRQCFNISENDLCAICSDKTREEELLCVVEEPLDIITIEKTKKMRGLYHVLGGLITAQNQKNLTVDELKKRLREGKIKEVILAMNPTTDGEATGLYLARILKPFGIKVTRLARGLSTGADIEYADVATLTGAIEGRKEM